MNATAIKLVIKLWHDDSPEDPTEHDGWKVYSFSTNHGNFKHPEEFDDSEMAEKVKAGLAFPLGYYEHGGCVWSLMGEGNLCRWDSVGHAGFMVWEHKESNLGPTTFEDRRKDARRTIEHYTSWCNGEVYGYTVEAFRACPTCEHPEELDEDEAGLDLPSCGGYYSDDIEGMVIDMKDRIGDDWADYEVEFKEHPYVSGMGDQVKTLWKGE